MRIRQWMVALTLACTACASAPAPIPTPTPQAPPEPTTAQLSLSGLPDITLPHSPRTAALREALALVEATRAREPNVWAPPEELQARRDADAQALLEVERIATSLSDSVEGDAVQVLWTLVHEQLIYRAQRRARLSEAQRADRDRALEACVAFGETDARLLPWTQHCSALITYWRDHAAWRAGPVWPEGCPAAWRPSTSGPESSSIPERPALALHISSDLSPSDEARVTAAVERALRARMPNAEVIPAAEVRADEQAFIAMRGIDGQACATPQHRLADAHPNLMSFAVDARCRRHRGRRVCTLTVTGLDHQHERREVVLAGERPTVADFEDAAARLDRASWEPRASRCIWSNYHVVPPNMCGESASLEDSDIDAALGPIHDEVQACRDADLAPAFYFRVRLDVAGDGGVRGVDIDHVAGPRRIACLTRAFREARFPAAQMPVVVAVYGWFEAHPTQSLPVRVEIEGRTWFEGRVDEELQACVDADSPVHVVDGTLHIAANGIASHADGEATDATSVCIRNALVGSAWPCTGERDVPMRLCIGNPVTPPEPVRP